MNEIQVHEEKTPNESKSIRRIWQFTVVGLTKSRL
jgi:hypothetical protein